MAGNETNTTETAIPVHTFFAYQSQDITFPQWVTLLTLCLAPLLVHIFGGTPTPIYLHSRKPRWHDLMVHYNPTSIIWRYFSIINRRLRRRNWDHTDLAVTNAQFWNGMSWDGSEQTLVLCRSLCVKTPPTGLGRLVSVESIFTLITGLQGAQAIYLIYAAPTGILFALDTVFMPVAILGLLRLLAAPWLTCDYVFATENGHSQLFEYGLNVRLHDDDISGAESQLVHHQDHPMISKSSSASTAANRSGWIAICGGIAIRAVYVGGLLILLIRCGDWMFNEVVGTKYFDALEFSLGIFYLTLMAVPTMIYIYYFIRSWKSSPSTIIPCISQLWYKLYTIVLLLGALVVITIAALETRRTSCGLYTIWDSRMDDELCRRFNDAPPTA